jgi:alpha-beta hydrolase superfamily lysophospholipase
METSTLTARDGHRISLCRWPVAGRPRGSVLIAHGMSEYAARYERFASDLNREGFEVHARDHRGHGPSAAPRGYFAAQDGWQKVVDDVDVVVDHLRAANPDLPLVLYGHSMGSFVARAYLLQQGPKLAGLALSATGYRQKYLAQLLCGVARWVGQRGSPEAPSRGLARLIFGSFNLSFAPARTPLDWLSRDPLEVDRYIADPLCGFAPSAALWQDLFGGIIALEDGEHSGRDLPRDCPVLLLAGSRDPVSLGAFGLGQLAARYRNAGLTQVDVKVYGGGRHEMHHELNRDEFMRDLLQWLSRVAPP